MTQLTQFFKWQFRDFCQVCASITVNKICLFLLGSQFAAAMIAAGRLDMVTLDILAVTTPVTFVIMCISWGIQMQWARFKRDQERIMNTLRDTK